VYVDAKVSHMNFINPDQTDPGNVATMNSIN
jgi:hypothetical protein